MGVEAPRTYINIALNRASLGDADNVFAYLDTPTGGMSGHVPRKDVTVIKQPIGVELAAKLSVKVVESHDDYDLTEVEIDRGETVILKVDRKTHQIIPIKSKPVYHE